MNKSILVLLSSLLLSLSSNFRAAAEEQVFIDDLTAPQLRTQINKIQEEIYRVFNLSNDDSKFEIVCHDYLPTGTSIKREVCEPQFVINRRTENARSARRGAVPLLTPLQLQGTLSNQFQTLTDKIATLSEENEYFGELNSILRMLTARLEEITS